MKAVADMIMIDRFSPADIIIHWFLLRQNDFTEVRVITIKQQQIQEYCRGAHMISFLQHVCVCVCVCVCVILDGFVLFCVSFDPAVVL